MSSSTPHHKFLLDENVRIELYKFLIRTSFDVTLSPKAAKDNALASISKTEDRILVTNDEDFTFYSQEKMFSVVWLRIQQHDIQSLLLSFEKMSQELALFAGKLVILHAQKWETFPLGENFETSK